LQDINSKSKASNNNSSKAEENIGTQSGGKEKVLPMKKDKKSNLTQDLNVTTIDESEFEVGESKDVKRAAICIEPGLQGISGESKGIDNIRSNKSLKINNDSNYELKVDSISSNQIIYKDSKQEINQQNIIPGCYNKETKQRSRPRLESPITWNTIVAKTISQIEDERKLMDSRAAIVVGDASNAVVSPENNNHIIEDDVSHDQVMMHESQDYTNYTASFGQNNEANAVGLILVPEPVIHYDGVRADHQVVTTMRTRDVELNQFSTINNGEIVINSNAGPQRLVLEIHVHHTPGLQVNNQAIEQPTRQQYTMQMDGYYQPQQHVVQQNHNIGMPMQQIYPMQFGNVEQQQPMMQMDGYYQPQQHVVQQNHNIGMPMQQIYPMQFGNVEQQQQPIMQMDGYYQPQPYIVQQNYNIGMPIQQSYLGSVEQQQQPLMQMDGYQPQQYIVQQNPNIRMQQNFPMQFGYFKQQEPMIPMNSYSSNIQQTPLLGSYQPISRDDGINDTRVNYSSQYTGVTQNNMYNRERRRNRHNNSRDL
jgi:hypothetical protein